MLNSDYTQESNIAGVMRLIIISDDAFLNEVEDWDFSTIDLKEGAILTEVIFAPNSCTFTYSSKPSEFGTLYQCQISCTKPKLTKAINQFLADNAERQWVSFVQDFNFKVHVVGVPNGGLKLVNTASTGGSINSNALSFVGDTLFPPFIFDYFDMNFFAGVDLTDYAMQDFRVMRGNSLYESIQFSNPDGTLQDLSSDQFVMNVVNNSGQVILTFARYTTLPGIVPEGGGDGPVLVENGLTISEDGTTIYMNKTGLEMQIEPGIYKYDFLRITDLASKTVMKGSFFVEANISNPPTPFV